MAPHALRALMLAAAGHAVRVSEDVTLYSNETATGTVCTEEAIADMKERFQIGDEFKRPCHLEHIWGDELFYSNPKNEKTIALYLYPKEDHNGAFGVCSGMELSPEFCSRILTDSDYMTVVFQRVSTVEEATDLVNDLSDDVVIKHLVLGGHGSPDSLHWGEDETEGTTKLETHALETERFLDAVYPHLLKGEEGQSTVFLDACLNAKKVCYTNMLQYVAHRLSGVKVFASKVSWSNEDFSLKGTGADFDGKIEQRKWFKKKNYMADAKFGSGELKDWEMETNHFCAFKDEMVKQEHISTMDTCHAACSADATCKAFIWYEGKSQHKLRKHISSVRKKCYLSTDCEILSEKVQGALVFYKPQK